MFLHPTIPRREHETQIDEVYPNRSQALPHISPDALRNALPQIGRSALFSDLLMMRYCASDPESARGEVRAPSTPTGNFAEAVRAYAGIVPLAVDPQEPGWRIHHSVSEATPTDYFFALASGGSGREKRWKKGGAFYARSGLHTRLYNGADGVIGECVRYSNDAPPDNDERRDIRVIEFDENYVERALDGLLDREPINFWAFVAWMLRTVEVPDLPGNDGLEWARTTVMTQARLNDFHVAETRGHALEQAAWFYLGDAPVPGEFFAPGPPHADELRAICEQFDERRTPLAAPPRVNLPAAAPEQAYNLLSDAGDGRRLVVDEEVVAAALTHLQLGRHLLIIGPPGTGKSTFAANLARAAREGLIDVEAPPADIHMATASANWTAFDTVGGYVPSRVGDLEFRPGVFLRAFRDDAWLVIDELNRADADKAFGSFMGVLARAGGAQVLPFELVAGETAYPVRILPADAEGDDTPGDFRVPDGWRVIGTMNTYDKNSLFRLSYAFMRRFAFIYFAPLDVEQTLEAASQDIDFDDDDASRLRTLLQACQDSGRALGVAIAADVARFVAIARTRDDVEEPFLDALVAHVLPQLDTLEPEAVGEFMERLLQDGVVAQGSRARIEEVFRQMLDYGR